MAGRMLTGGQDCDEHYMTIKTGKMFQEIKKR